MPTSSGFRIGNDIQVPATPGFVILKVPPARSSAPSCFTTPAPPRRGSPPRIGEPHPVGVADDGHDQPLKVEIDHDPEPDRAVDDERRRR